MTKIQNLPESTRKIILWSVIIIIGLSLFAFYIKNVQKKLKSFEVEEFKKELQLPSFGEELKRLQKIEFPKIEIPEFDEEKLKELEKMIEETQKQK